MYNQSMSIEIRLTKDLLQRLSSGESLHLIICPPIKARKSSVEMDRIPADIRKLVSLWNDSDYIKSEASGESRNNPIGEEDVLANRRLLERALREIGMPKIKTAMDRYFRACHEGRHIWGGSNHGYAHLAGFLRRLLNAKGKNLWWMSKRQPGRFEKPKSIRDDHPELTQKMADMYAKRFLGRKTYGLANPSDEYKHFLEAADWVQAEAGRGAFSEDDVIGLLFDVVENLTDELGGVATPGWLSSEKVWKNHVSQRIRKMLKG